MGRIDKDKMNRSEIENKSKNDICVKIKGENTWILNHKRGRMKTHNWTHSCLQSVFQRLFSSLSFGFFSFFILCISFRWSLWLLFQWNKNCILEKNGGHMQRQIQSKKSTKIYTFFVFLAIHWRQKTKTRRKRFFVRNIFSSLSFVFVWMRTLEYMQQRNW